MSKETEEILGMVLIGFVVLSLLSRTAGVGGSAAAVAISDNNTNLGYAADAASVLQTAINDWS